MYIDNHSHVMAKKATQNGNDVSSGPWQRRPAHRLTSPLRAARWTAGALALLTMVLGACAGDTAAESAVATARSGDTDVVVVATTTVLGEIAAAVVGDAGEVVTLLPAGSDPHTYQPSARQIGRLVDADFVVENGGGLEAGLTDALAEARAGGVPVFTAIEHTDLEPLDHAGVHGQDDAGHEHGEEPASDGEGSEAEDQAVDPHVFLDPVRMAEITRALGSEIETALELTGAGERAEDHAAALEALDDRVRERLSVIPETERKLVTNHDAFGYFADRYGFVVVGTVIPSVSTGAEPSARDLEDLVGVIREEGVRAVFVETTAPQRLAQTLAEEVGGDVAVVQLYTEALGDAGSEAGTYVDMMQTNADRIAAALSPGRSPAG